MNKDQKLLEEAYQSIYESSEQELLKHIKRETAKLKDPSDPISMELGTDEKGSFVYKSSIYKPGGVYKSYIGSLFSSDLKEVPRSTPIKEGMMWTEQDINTKIVYRATNIEGRLMKKMVPPQEAREKGLTSLVSNYTLEKEAERKHNGNIDLARGWRILYAPKDFNVKFYSAEEILRSLEAMHKEGVIKSEYETLVGYYKKMFKEKEIDSTLSKDFDISALEGF
jgi:hypothetical protein